METLSLSALLTATYPSEEIDIQLGHLPTLIFADNFLVAMS